jgi:tetratricopeptide (TPR) repeat protein
MGWPTKILNFKFQISDYKHNKFQKLILVMLVSIMVIVTALSLSKNKVKKIDAVSNETIETAKTVETAASSRLLSRVLYNEGWEAYQVRRLAPSIAKWELTLELWPSNSAARVKLDAARKELKDIVESGYARGLVSFQSLHYARAIREWEAVLAVLGGAKGEQYNKIISNINEARVKLKEGNL